MAGGGAASYVIVYRFMWDSLGLSGVPLMLYARVFGFCRSGGSYWESKGNAARFLGVSEREVYRAMARLVAAGLVVESGTHALDNGRRTKRYRVSARAVREALERDYGPLAEVATPDGASGEGGPTGDGMSGAGVTGCQPIGKG